MLITVLGDIHGNIEALRVAYEAAIANQAEKIISPGRSWGLCTLCK